MRTPTLTWDERVVEDVLGEDAGFVDTALGDETHDEVLAVLGALDVHLEDAVEGLEGRVGRRGEAGQHGHVEHGTCNNG